jgi:hypothetical protein
MCLRWACSIAAQKKLKKNKYGFHRKLRKNKNKNKN